MLDLKIQNGSVVDGRGGPARRVDIGVEGGVIVAMGDLRGVAAGHTEDAEGLLVTPGFVDLHTHYDGQASWDADLAPSSLHGVTTAVMGSCGVGFAPVRAADRATLVALMEGVEDIPGSALSEGIRWGWESFGEYLDVLDKQGHTIDLAGHMTHDALRVYVMGERAVAQEAATDADITAMSRLLREGLQAGAVGFSTGRTDNHRSASGAATPASEASIRELVGLAGALVGLDHGVLQVVSDFDMAAGPDRFDAEFDVIQAMAAAAGGRPTSISLMQRDGAPDQWRQILSRCESAVAAGVPLRVQVAPRAIGVLLGLGCTFHPFIGKPSYKRLAHLPVSERARRMADPTVRAAILSEPNDRVAGDGSPVPPMVDGLLATLDRLAFRLFRLGERPDYEPPVTRSIGAAARMSGRSPLDALYDALLEKDGEELIYFPIFNYGGFDLEVVRGMMEHPLALPGLSDGGAHVGTVCDASFPTFYLTHWARDREQGRWPVERAVAFLSQVPAAYLGLNDRGTLEIGKKADINLIDHAALSLMRPRLVHDLPAGGRRLIQEARGFCSTWVSGQAVLRDGQFTGARPGRVVRGGR